MLAPRVSNHEIRNSGAEAPKFSWVKQVIQTGKLLVLHGTVVSVWRAMRTSRAIEASGVSQKDLREDDLCGDCDLQFCAE